MDHMLKAEEKDVEMADDGGPARHVIKRCCFVTASQAALQRLLGAAARIEQWDGSCQQWGDKPAECKPGPANEVTATAEAYCCHRAGMTPAAWQCCGWPFLCLPLSLASC